MSKRKENDPLLGPAKKMKVEPRGSMAGQDNGCSVNGNKDWPCGGIVAGRSQTLTSRENKLFDAIVGLITKDSENRVCSSSSNLLSEAGSVLMMEFDRVCKIEAAAAVAKHPIISFSDNFVDSESSRIIKSVLLEIFEGEAHGEDPDYLFAFSRQGNVLHFRTYQVLEVPNLSTSKKKLKLSNLVHHFSFTSMSFTAPGLGDVKTSKDFELLEDNVFVGDQSLGILHSASVKGSVIHFVLDELPDLSSWDGFTSCLSDFKERNEPTFSGRLLGDTRGKRRHYPNERYKSVIRSLLINALGLHGKELCFHKISDSDVCLRGTTVKLSWRLLEFDVVIARSNRREIRALILNMFVGKKLPRDLKALLQLLDCEYLVPSEYLITHCSLMHDVNKSHMIDDIYTEFNTNMTIRHKLLVAEPLCYYINNWEELIRPNVLLSGISTHKFGLEKGPEALSDMFVEIAPEERKVNMDDSEVAPGEDQENKDDVEVDGGNIHPRLHKARGVRILIAFVRHSKVHLFDEVKTQFRNQQIKLQRRETVRIITSRLPILHILQNELRNIVGDKWFAKYFNHA